MVQGIVIAAMVAVVAYIAKLVMKAHQLEIENEKLKLDATEKEAKNEANSMSNAELESHIKELLRKSSGNS